MTRYLLLVLFTTTVAAQGTGLLSDKVLREKVSGIDLVVCRTEVKDVVTLHGSLPAGTSLAPKENVAIPTLVGEMLDKGTEKQNKFAIAQRLDRIGAKIDFTVEGALLEFEAKCLSKDLPLVVSLLAEQLRMPSFSKAEFEKTKKQISGDLQRALESTDFQAEQAFAETVFPPGHPNYSPPVRAFLTALDAATVEELERFHATYYGPAQLTLVAVGDIDVVSLRKAIAATFAGWSGGRVLSKFSNANIAERKREQTISMPDKASVTVLLGAATGLCYQDPDALALRIGTTALGQGFTGRLMANVRDKEGLTYGIGAGIKGDEVCDGSWQITAEFAPQLLEKGMLSTQRELQQWWQEGITAAELDRVKSNVIGSFKVGLATTDGLSSALLKAIQRGYDVTWLDEFPGRVEALTLPEVNAAIKKHLQPDKMTIIKAGSVSLPADHR